VQAVDAQHAIAWKNGCFIFNDESIQGIMRQVARWYDVDVQYQGALAGKNFNGTASRYQDAAAGLHMLERYRALYHPGPPRCGAALA
jgi:ferric-dicitrate binding protein FerR (iron transport regulator)